METIEENISDIHKEAINKMVNLYLKNTLESSTLLLKTLYEYAHKEQLIEEYIIDQILICSNRQAAYLQGGMREMLGPSYFDSVFPKWVKMLEENIKEITKAITTEPENVI